MDFNSEKYFVENSDALTEAEKIQFAKDLIELERQNIVEYRDGRWRLIAAIEIEETQEGPVIQGADPCAEAINDLQGRQQSALTSRRNTMQEETPEVQTAGFVATKDEIENLALEYWNDVIDFKWDRFTWPDEPINTPQMDSFRLALIRLGDIAAVLGNERMEAIRYIALDRFRSPFTTDEQWAAFMAYAPMFLRPVEVTLS
jgi:hypothetical protein